MLIHAFCKICESEIVFVYFLERFLVLIFLELTTLTKPMNNQTNSRIALEKLKKIWIYLTIVFSLLLILLDINDFLQTFQIVPNF